jgi:pyruvate formate lyase activating enzyme
MLPITAITKFTFQDYPEHTACIIWFGGCNFRCPYCHNPEFVFGKLPAMPEKEVFDFLETRKGLLDGVVLSGGECTLSDNIFEFVEKIKNMNFKIKIDTNGSNYQKIKNLADKNFIDFIALDIKAPKHKFKLISKSDRYEDFTNTLDLLCKNKIPSEVRTTVHTDLIQEDDINEIIDNLDKRGYKGIYYIQNYRNDNNKTLENLKEQKRILDKNQLIKPKGFKLEFRNFW